MVWHLVKAPGSHSPIFLLPSNLLPLSPSFCLFFPPIQPSQPFSPLSAPHYHLSPFTPAPHHSLLFPSLSLSLIIPVVFPLLYWQVLVIPDSPQRMIGVFQTFPPQVPLPLASYPQGCMQLENGLNWRIRTSKASLKSAATSLQTPPLPLVLNLINSTHLQYNWQYRFIAMSLPQYFLQRFININRTFI